MVLEQPRFMKKRFSVVTQGRSGTKLSYKSSRKSIIPEHPDRDAPYDSEMLMVDDKLHSMQGQDEQVRLRAQYARKSQIDTFIDVQIHNNVLEKSVLADFLTPGTRPYFIRQWATLILTFYNCLYVPMPAFYDPELGSILSVQIFNALVDILFLLDLIFNFYTAYINAWGQIVWNLHMIRKRYMESQFIYDLLSCIPLELGALALGFSAGTQENSLCRLMRIFRFHRLYTSELIQSKSVTLRLMRLLVFLMLVCHWMGAMFFGLGRLQTEGNEWTGEKWTVEANIAEADLFTQFMTSLYYAIVTILTVGYGDIRPHTNIEKMSAVMMILGGAVFYAVIFGNVNVLIQNTDKSATILRLKLDALTHFCRHYRLPHELETKLVEALKARFNIDHGLSLDHVVKALPPTICEEVMMLLRSFLITESPWFSKVEDLDFVKRMVVTMETEIFLADEIVYSQGSPGGFLGFVSQGILRAHVKKRVRGEGRFGHGKTEAVKKFVEGASFGGVSFFLKQPRRSTVTTSTNAEICKLGRRAFQQLLVIFPQYKHHFRRLAKKRQRAEHKTYTDPLEEKVKKYWSRLIDQEKIETPSPIKRPTRASASALDALLHDEMDLAGDSHRSHSVINASTHSHKGAFSSQKDSGRFTHHRSSLSLPLRKLVAMEKKKKTEDGPKETMAMKIVRTLSTHVLQEKRDTCNRTGDRDTTNNDKGSEMNGQTIMGKSGTNAAASNDDTSNAHNDTVQVVKPSTVNDSNKNNKHNNGTCESVIQMNGSSRGHAMGNHNKSKYGSPGRRNHAELQRQVDQMIISQRHLEEKLHQVLRLLQDKM